MSVCRFGVGLKHALFAIVFATRPANFHPDLSNTRTDIQENVHLKHPLGSNILPFLDWPKFTVKAPNCCNPSSASIWRWGCDREVVRASRPAEKRQTDLSTTSWLCCTAQKPTAKIEVPGSRKSTKSYRRIGVFPLLFATEPVFPRKKKWCSLLPLPRVARVPRKARYRA